MLFPSKKHVDVTRHSLPVSAAARTGSKTAPGPEGGQQGGHGRGKGGGREGKKEGEGEWEGTGRACKKGRGGGGRK